MLLLKFYRYSIADAGRVAQACIRCRTPRGIGPVSDRQAQDRNSGLRLRRRLRPGAAFGHELIELRLILGHAQPIKEFLKRAVLFF